MLQEGEVALGSPALYDASSIVHRFHIRKSSGSRHLYYNGKKVKKAVLVVCSCISDMEYTKRYTRRCKGNLIDIILLIA